MWIGGDEFVLFVEVSVFDEVVFFVSVLVYLIDVFFMIDLYELVVIFSVGIVFYLLDGKNEWELMFNVDVVMYYMKYMGCNGYYFF